jgi:hypothetical protein
MWYFIVSAIVLVLAATAFCLWWFWLRLLPPSWKRCTLASLWDGPNAERRMMNMLSPHFSDGKFRDYLKWQKKTRDCNTVHLFLANWRDGEGGGYSIYGPNAVIDWHIDKNHVKVMTERILECRKAGMAVVPWLFADDSTAWNRRLLSDPDRYVRDLVKQGLLKYAAMVCVGLELDEYASDAQVAATVAALRKHWGGKVATHHVSNSLRFAHHGDIVFAQVNPSTSDADMLAFAARVRQTGKPCGIIEHRRNPDRPRSRKLIDAGLPFVGNW